MFKKKGYSASPVNPLSKDVVLADPIIVERMTKLAHEIKSIAPKSDDFLYFSIIFLKAAESALLDEKGELKKVGSERAWGYFDENWKWHGNVKPHRNNNCFIPGTFIQMMDGSVKKIEDVKVGDLVITHTGSIKPVVALMKNNFSGKVLKINSRNNSSLTCTSEHPFFSLKTNGRGLRSVTKSNGEKFKFDFNTIGSLSVGDLLTSSLKIKADVSKPEDLTVDSVRLLGIFAAKGSYSKKYGKRQAVNFTLGFNEKKQSDLIKELFSREFPECSVIVKPNEKRSVTNITVTGHNIAEFFHQHVGEYSHQKTLSMELVHADDSIKKSFITGWLDGDGCLSESNKLVGITTSENLAYQIRLMLNSMNVMSSLRTVKSKGTFKYPATTDSKYVEKKYSTRDSYRVEIYGSGYKELDLDKNSAKYTFDESLKTKDYNYIKDGYRLHSISDIEELDYSGPIYNFQVKDDNSYVANGVIVHNCDIFPEVELKKAASKWIGMPLCKDHESSSVDGIRGIILDTYYDEKMKQVVGLCALDRVNYGDLARKVETGIVRYGSMGTAVETSVCTECYNFAKTAEQYCNHVKSRSAWGEINVGLKPIEYSLVVQPAEPGAILLRCIASLKDYKNEFMNYGVENVDEMLGKLSLEQAQHLNTIVKTACGNEDSCSPSERKRIITSFLKNNSLVGSSSTPVSNETSTTSSADWYRNTGDFVSTNTDGVKDFSGLNGSNGVISTGTENAKDRGDVFLGDSVLDKDTPDVSITNSASKKQIGIKKAKSLISTIMEDVMNESKLKERAELRKKLAYHQGGSDKKVEPAGYKSKPYSFNEDKHMKQTKSMGSKDGSFPGDEKVKQKLSRAELEERQMKRLAYYQGGSDKKVEPAGFKSKPFSYNEDKHMKQTKSMGSKDGRFPGDDKIKQEQKRASYEGPALSTKLSWPVNSNGSINKSAALFEVYAGQKKVIAATGHEIFGSEIGDNWDWFTSKSYGQQVCKEIRASGLPHVAALLKGAQAAAAPTLPAPPPPPPGPGADMAPPPDAGMGGGGMPPMPDMGGSDEGDKGDESAKESPKDVVEGALTEMESQIDKAKGALKELGDGGEVNINVNSDGSEKEGPKLASSISTQLKTAIAEMNESADELAMIAETYAGAHRLSRDNKIELDKIANASLREASALIGQTKTLTKMASSVAASLTKFAKVAYAEDESMDDDASDMESEEDDASDMSSMDDDAHDMKSMDDDASDMKSEEDDAEDGVNELISKAMDLRRMRREQLVVQAKKKDPKAEKEKAKKLAEKEKEKKMAEKEKAEAKAEKEKAAKKKAKASEESSPISKSAALRDMVNDAFQTKKAEDEKESYKVRLRRAYDVALEMQKKGLIALSKTALDRQVDDIMEFDDKAFESYKRSVANARPVETVKIAKDLGGLNVGVDSSSERTAAPKTTSEILRLMWE
jgi:hypothetical protein